MIKHDSEMFHISNVLRLDQYLDQRVNDGWELLHTVHVVSPAGDNFLLVTFRKEIGNGERDNQDVFQAERVHASTAREGDLQGVNGPSSDRGIS